MLATADEPAECELQAEEEEQEHKPDLGDEVRHLGRPDEAGDLRLMRPEEEPRKQISRDGRNAQPVGAQAESSEQKAR